MAHAATEADGPLGSFLQDWRLLRPDLEPVAFSIVAHVRHLNLFLGQILNEAAAEFDITGADVGLMMAIRRDKGGKPARPSELSDRLGLTRATITYRVDRVLDLGLAERIDDPSDRRALFVQLTRKGDLVLAEVMTRFASEAEDKLGGVDGLPGGRKGLEEGLKAMIAEFEKP